MFILAHWWDQVAAPEAYTAEMARGTTIPFTVSAYPGQTWSGTIARIAHAVDVTTRTMAVELDVTNSDGRLSPGTFCQIRWPLVEIFGDLKAGDEVAGRGTDELRPDTAVRAREAKPSA